MFSVTQIKLIAVGIVFAIIFVSSLWVKNLYDNNMKCKINTKTEEDKHKIKIKYYEENIHDIIEFYNGEIEAVGNFKKGTNETDCEASKRFFNSRSY